MFDEICFKIDRHINIQHSQNTIHADSNEHFSVSIYKICVLLIKDNVNCQKK